MPKSTKRLIISTDSLNSQGYRVLTEGIDMTGFDKNPLMLFNHIRPQGNDKNQILPIGHWEDMEVNGDELSGVPVFDDNDEFAMQIYNKVEGGHIRMCSVGLLPIEVSDDLAMYVEGQRLPTVTKSVLKEVSIADLGANPDSLDVALYDVADNIIMLSERLESFFSIINKTTMAKKPTAAEIAAAKKTIELADKSRSSYIASKAPTTATLTAAKAVLKLAEDSGDKDDDTTDSDDAKDKKQDDGSEAALADDDVEDKDKQIEGLKNQLAELTKKMSDMQAAQKDAAEKDKDAKCATLVDNAINAKKISLSQKDSYLTLAKKDYATTEKLLKDMKANPSIKTIMESAKGGGKTEAKLETLREKSFDELFKSGDLQFVKLNDFDLYSEKFTEKFGKAPKAE